MNLLGQIVDEIAEAPLEAVTLALRNLPSESFGDVCSIVEYELYRRHGRPELPRLCDFNGAEIARRVARIVDGVRGTTRRDLQMRAVDTDAIGIPPPLGQDVAWTAFVKRAEFTARAAGFPETVAAGVAGAIQEMADNIVQHSEAPTSGIAAFARIGGRFDYVVGDTGIGMLRSLRQAPEYRSLRDDLEALPLAVTPGVSRYGRGIGRGYGFRAVFLPLRGGHGTVRLRSGQGLLELQGVGVRPDQGVCSQRPAHPGVVVAVHLRPTS